MRLMFREKAVRQIHQVPGKNRTVVISKQGHWRIQNLGRVNPHQIPILSLKKLEPGNGKRFQCSAESILHLARTVSDSSDLSVLSAEERHNPVCLAQRIGF